MLSSKGLRPHRMALSASRRSLPVPSVASRKISSFTPRAGLSTLRCRSNPLQSANWRACSPHVAPAASSVRYGSGWSWGGAGGDGPPTTTPLPPELVPEYVPVPGSVVTSTTPELAPAGIDQPAVVDSTLPSGGGPKAVEDILSFDPPPIPDPTPYVDPANTVSYWGNLKDLGLDYGWGPTTLYENIVELAYLHAGVGWSGSILLSSLAIRCGLFYFQMKGSENGVKMAALKPLTRPIVDEQEVAKAEGDNDKVWECKTQQASIYKAAGVKPWHSFRPMILNAVIGFGAFKCLRGMTTLPVAGMHTEGLLWFRDLTVPDPYFAVPLLTGGVLYVLIKLGGESATSMDGGMNQMQKKLVWIMPAITVLFSAYQPASIQLYFLISAFLGGLTAYTLKLPMFRNMARLRQLPSKATLERYSRVIKTGATAAPAPQQSSPGKIRYQAPAHAARSRTITTTPSAPANKTPRASPPPSATRIAGLKLKEGTKLPPHMRVPEHLAPPATPVKKSPEAADPSTPASSPGIRGRLKSLQRELQPRAVWERVKEMLGQDSRPAEAIAASARKRRMKAAANKYEAERKRRFER